MNFDKLDKIKMSKSDVDMLFSWRDNHKDYVREFKPVLLQGVIELDDFHRQVFNDHGNVLEYNIYNNFNGEWKLSHSLTWNKDTKEGFQTFSMFEKNEGFDMDEYNSSVISLHASLMAYMEYYGDKKEYVEKEDKVYIKKSKVKKSSKKKSNGQVKIKKKVYIIHIDKDAIKLDKRRYERHMEKWTVRGHWRTLKSGNKTWVKPCVKGEGKNVQAKEYKL